MNIKQTTGNSNGKAKIIPDLNHNKTLQGSLHAPVPSDGQRVKPPRGDLDERQEFAL